MSGLAVYRQARADGRDLGLDVGFGLAGIALLHGVEDVADPAGEVSAFTLAEAACGHGRRADAQTGGDERLCGSLGTAILSLNA